MTLQVQLRHNQRKTEAIKKLLESQVGVWGWRSMLGSARLFICPRL